MTTLIVDTDVVSFLLKEDTRAQLYLPHLRGKTLALSFMTLAELYQWAYIRNWGTRKLVRMEEQLDQYVVVPFDKDLCKQWAAIAVERQRIGRPISVQRFRQLPSRALARSCCRVPDHKPKGQLPPAVLL